MLRPVENLSSECPGAFEHGGGTAGRPTQWLLFPPPSHTLIQFVMDRRDGGRFNLSQKETLKWTSGGAEGLDRVEVAAK